MRKISLAAILLVGSFHTSFAQTDNSAPAAKKEKMTDQYIGVQLNGLIRQVFNFNNNTSSTNVNPYLLTYNLNSKRTGWGLRAGIGYSYSSNNSNDGITNTTTKLNDMQVRVGIEKAFKLSDRWSAGVGIDGVMNMNNDNTSTTIHSSDTVTTETAAKSTGFGGGAMGWLRYNITARVLIGTEASFYYVSTKENNKVTITDRQFDPFGNGNVVTSTETTTKPKTAAGTFNSPIVFYLIVKF